MDRLIGTLTALLVLALLLPAIAGIAQGAVPALVALLVLLGFVRLLWPSGRKS